jgi:hypothetical protein
MTFTNMFAPQDAPIKLYLDESGTLGYSGEIFTMAIVQVRDLPQLETSIAKHRVTQNESKASQMRTAQKLSLARTLIEENDIKVMLADLDPRAAMISERKLDKDMLYDSMAGQAIAYYLQRGDLLQGAVYRLSMDIRGSLRESYEDLVSESIGNLLIHREHPLVRDIDVRFLDSKYSAGVQAADLFSNIYRTALSQKDNPCQGFLRKYADEGIICGGFTFGLSQLADQMEQIAHDMRAYAEASDALPRGSARHMFATGGQASVGDSAVADARPDAESESEGAAPSVAEQEAESSPANDAIASQEVSDEEEKPRTRRRGHRGGRNRRKSGQAAEAAANSNDQREQAWAGEAADADEGPAIDLEDASAALGEKPADAGLDDSRSSDAGATEPGAAEMGAPAAARAVRKRRSYGASRAEGTAKDSASAKADSAASATGMSAPVVEADASVSSEAAAQDQKAPAHEAESVPATKRTRTVRAISTRTPRKSVSVKEAEEAAEKPSTEMSATEAPASEKPAAKPASKARKPAASKHTTRARKSTAAEPAPAASQGKAPAAQPASPELASSEPAATELAITEPSAPETKNPERPSVASVAKPARSTTRCRPGDHGAAGASARNAQTPAADAQEPSSAKAPASASQATSESAATAAASSKPADTSAGGAQAAAPESVSESAPAITTKRTSSRSGTRASAKTSSRTPSRTSSRAASSASSDTAANKAADKASGTAAGAALGKASGKASKAAPRGAASGTAAKPASRTPKRSSAKTTKAAKTAKASSDSGKGGSEANEKE